MLRQRGGYPKAGDVWIDQDPGGDLEFFVWTTDDGNILRRVSSFHPTYESAEKAAEAYKQSRG